MKSLVAQLWDIHKKMSDGVLLTRKGTLFPSHTLSGFKATIQWFEKYNYALSEPLTELYDNFSEEYVRFLMLQPVLRNNSVFIFCKRLRILFKRLGLSVSFNVSEEEITTVYLNAQELEQIENYKPQNSAQLETQRRFLIASATGLRYSDLKRVVQEPGKYLVQHNGKWCLHLRQTKTNGSIVIPLSEKTLGYLRETKFRIKSSQTYNANLKRIVKASGIDAPILTEYTLQGKRVEVQYPKYQLISSHTARRSFATNAFLANIPVLSIMRITGHKTSQSFMTYIRISTVENAVQLADHPFFK